MDGGGVGTSVLEQFADYVMAAALRAGYDVRPGKRTGDKKRLAEDAGMDPGTLSRLLKAERMPEPRSFAGLAKALRLPLTTMLVEAGIIPAESLTREHLQSVSSHPITPDEVAESWGIQDEAGRLLVRAMYERLAKNRQQADNADQEGGAEAEA
jgi:transcriptional regulator with XRE-family HTH domain